MGLRWPGIFRSAGVAVVASAVACGLKASPPPRLALGSPSGSQIITCVALTVLNYIAYRAPLYESVAALRYHHQWLPDVLAVEDPGFSAPVTAELQGMGYEIRREPIGCKIEAVAFENGRLHGVADPRGEGMAIGDGPVRRRAEGVVEAPVRHD
jgi:gamma-glutamyltranspeptidase/glutathione hydrolase